MRHRGSNSSDRSSGHSLCLTRHFTKASQCVVVMQECTSTGLGPGFAVYIQTSITRLNTKYYNVIIEWVRPYACTNLVLRVSVPIQT